MELEARLRRRGLPCGGAICGPRSFSKIGRRAESELAHLTDRPTLHHPAVRQQPAASQPAQQATSTQVRFLNTHPQFTPPSISPFPKLSRTPVLCSVKGQPGFSFWRARPFSPLPPPPVAHPAALSLSLSWYLAQARRQTTPSRRRTPRRHPSYPAWRASLPLQRRRPSSTPFLGLAQRQARADRRQNEVRVSTLQQAPDAGREQHADSDQNTPRAQLER